MERTAAIGGSFVLGNCGMPKEHRRLNIFGSSPADVALTLAAMRFCDDDDAKRSAKVGASVKRKGEACGAPLILVSAHAIATTINGRDLQVFGFRRVFLIVVKEPPIIAVVFPWDRNRKRNSNGLQGLMVALAGGKANATANSGEGRWRRKNGRRTAVPIRSPVPPCELATAGNVLVEVTMACSFLIFTLRNEKEGKVLLPPQGLGLQLVCSI
ncbi:uncharacterized protein DS421_10g296340 [Arachis hypogaea]|nr:uncharacterized protein DS421_10g296340 [Arachis hypogaea]